MALQRRGSVQRAAGVDRRDQLRVETPRKDLWLQLLALRWPVALASAALLPLTLPLPGNPVTLAGFVAFIGGAVLVSSVRWLIIFLPVLAALGPYFLAMQIAGINLFGFRLLIMILATLSTPLTSRSEWWFNPVARYTVVFMVLWVAWGFLSLLWTPDPAGGLSEVLTLIFGLGLILTLFNLRCQAPQNLDMLRFGWVFAFVVVAAQASWEILTGARLPSFMTERHEAYLDSTVVQATLGSPTGFGGFLLLATTFLLWSMERARGLEKFLYVGLLVAAGAGMLYSASRISFIGFALQLIVYFLVLERRWYVRVAAAVCGVLAIGLGPSMLMQSEFKLAQKFDVAATYGTEGSIGERMTLTVNGIWMALETGGRGVGADGYEETTASGDVLIPLRVQHRGSFKPAHNVWAEILAEYGVPAFGGLMVLFGWAARLGWQARRSTAGERGAVGRAVLAGLVGYAFYGVGSGSVIGQATNWMFLATLSALAAFLYERGRRPRRRMRPGGLKGQLDPDDSGYSSPGV